MGVTQIRFLQSSLHIVSMSYRHSSPGHTCVTQSLCMRSHRNGCVSGCHIHSSHCREPSRSTPPHTLKNTDRKDGWRRDSAEGRKAKLWSHILRAGFEVSLVNSSPSWCMCVMQLRSGWKEPGNDSVGPLRHAPLYLNSACRRGKRGGELQKTEGERERREPAGLKVFSQWEWWWLYASKTLHSHFHSGKNWVKCQHFISNCSLMQELNAYFLFPVCNKKLKITLLDYKLIRKCNAPVPYKEERRVRWSLFRLVTDAKLSYLF